MISISNCQDTSRCPNGCTIVRRNSAMAAIFGAVARNAVTGVGAPS